MPFNEYIMSHPLLAISPIDGRYAELTRELSEYFSEYAFFKYRFLVEIEYFIALSQVQIIKDLHIDAEKSEILRGWIKEFSLQEALNIKEIENTTRHDVKALEYFIKQKFEQVGWGSLKEWIHFGLTSQDVNNTAIPLMLKEFTNKIYLPLLHQLLDRLKNLVSEWKDIPMLAHTHGQPASPTVLGKEIQVFVVRLENQLSLLQQIPFSAKFGGATGNMNAHYAAFPQVDWHAFADRFVNQQLGLKRSYPTTQIDHYDHLAAYFDALKRINTILVDLSRDMWQYISMEYFLQKVVAGEVGSSAMPHKVNPIDFENAEGNLMYANALFEFLSQKLPISRLQRDLTDSTVLRNIGVPLSHTIIAFKSLLKGLSKIKVNHSAIQRDLENNWAVVAEAIQTILRRENYPNPYEALKALSRRETPPGKHDFIDFINNLQVPQAVKEELFAISPFNYIGKWKTS
ncbi:adenylosuccinate lyase [Thermaurantimonas aggregans]|uniref:Adenylosuccinate lyase n=2 Tax=Thermaurantimonas aggregans TaxID=2173829 RepID=A0A401XJ66_9FLAO|nr:adenylosuccinate lyase [Thermaurantimonas aggregans]